ncbi:MAG TPA: hypothetical protein VE132_15525 [Micromonosporaceae bacterium]|nr:hypothetical protein [Micromonosporaceae bacterium]
MRQAAGADRGRLVASLGRLMVATARAARSTHPLRVAIDGSDAAGKTTPAEEIAASIGSERPVIRASIDGFHHPADVRRRRGPMPAEGYYRDSFDIDAVVRSLLDPLGPGGDRRYRAATFDYRTEAPLDLPWRIAPDDAVLLFDLPGQEIYRAQVHPYAWADVVVDNEDVSRPYPLKWPTSRGDGRDGREPPH